MVVPRVQLHTRIDKFQRARSETVESKVRSCSSSTGLRPSSTTGQVTFSRSLGGGSGGLSSGMDLLGAELIQHTGKHMYTGTRTSTRALQNRLSHRGCNSLCFVDIKIARRPKTPTNQPTNRQINSNQIQIQFQFPIPIPINSSSSSSNSSSSPIQSNPIQNKTKQTNTQK